MLKDFKLPFKSKYTGGVDKLLTGLDEPKKNKAVVERKFEVNLTDLQAAADLDKAIETKKVLLKRLSDNNNDYGGEPNQEKLIKALAEAINRYGSDPYTKSVAKKLLQDAIHYIEADIKDDIKAIEDKGIRYNK